ncbi:hypothetical protein [Moorena sp. SIO3A2]|uniref:hypothetical protein n=1 Tax=Moorena sp. SIO3A2 TaxID=2607841 RepID=UPI0013B83775|nr:hypothetical protein [Moorena sp. SIO3A2]NER86350.1 hypothetical protein [Moorena sp. SIO3A2]
MPTLLLPAPCRVGKSTRFLITWSEGQHLPTLRLLIFSSGQDAHSTVTPRARAPLFERARCPLYCDSSLLPITHYPLPITYYLFPIPYSH